MRITIIPEDRMIRVDDDLLIDIEQDWSWVSPDIHAVQWYDDHGEIEFTDDRPNEKITDLGPYFTAVQMITSEKYRREQLEIANQAAREAARNYWNELRSTRNYLLSQSDWTQVIDSPLTESQKIECMNFRRQLRDFPSTVIDPKPLVNEFIDGNYTSWPTIPSYVTIN